MDPEEALRYLLKAGLLPPEAVLDCDLVVRSIGRRNLNTAFIRGIGPSFFVKASRDRSIGASTLAHEAAIYELLATHDGGQSSPPGYLVRYVGYDASADLLILEFESGAEDLRSYYGRRRRYPAGLAFEVGYVLATLHNQRPVPLPAPGTPSNPPTWWFRLHRPSPWELHHISNAGIEMIRLVQVYEDFGALLDDVGSDWRLDGLIHGDVRWDNFLCRPSPSPRQWNLKLVDWELARPGDVCWDVGSVFNDYLLRWIMSVPVMRETPSDGVVAKAAHPLTAMQPSMRSFWRSYAQARQWGADEAREQLLRSVRFAGVRLLQSAYEQVQDSVELTGNVVCLLQLSFNILRRPHDAAVQLLGVD